MNSLSLSHSLRRLWALERFGPSLRFFIALAGCMTWSWYSGQMELLTPLFLGVIASALAESDDSWQGRLFSLCVTLPCFLLVSVSVQFLHPSPWLFASVLTCATFCLIMLGALGERYATIAYATLILAIYTMIGLEQSNEALMSVSIWQQPTLLVTGAAIYGALSTIWYGIFSQQPLQHSLARVFREQCHYLKAKSALFEPLRNVDLEGHRLAVATQNSRVVAALNDTKNIILHRVGRRSSNSSSKVNRYLKLYFLAQDIHERASSSHHPYQKLSEAFFHSDVLFRCLRLLRQQGDGCKALAKAIELRQPFDYGGGHSAALEDLQGAIAYLKQQNNPEWRDLLRSLRALANNLSTLDHLLRDAANPDALALSQDSAILDRDPKSLKEAFERIRQDFSIHSLLFRHALRLSLKSCRQHAPLSARVWRHNWDGRQRRW